MNNNKLLSGEYIPVPEASWSFRNLVGQIIRQMPWEGEKILFVEAAEVGGPPDSLAPAIFRYKNRAARADPIIVLDSDEEEELPSFILMVTVKDDVVREHNVEEERELHVKRSRRVKKYARKIRAATVAPGTSSGMVSEDNPQTQRIPEGDGPSVRTPQRLRKRPDPLSAILERQAAATEDVATGVHSIAAALLQIASEGGRIRPRCGDAQRKIKEARRNTQAGDEAATEP